jgi:hypothetical protein
MFGKSDCLKDICGPEFLRLATGFWQLAVRSKGNFRVLNVEGNKIEINRNILKYGHLSSTCSLPVASR